MKIEVEVSHYNIVVRINGVTHLRLERRHYLGHQSWLDGNDRNKFVIEYTLVGGQITCDYDSREKWVTILDGLDRALEGK